MLCIGSLITVTGLSEARYTPPGNWPALPLAEVQYALIDPADPEKVRSAQDKTINITAFIRPDAVYRVYQAGGTYYLVPDGPVAQKPYALLHKVMEQEGQYAFAQVLLRDREQIVLLRPMGRVNAMTWLDYAQAVNDQVRPGRAPASLQDESPEAGRVEVKGQEVIAPPPEEAPATVINLMDALQKSVAAAKNAAGDRP